MLFSSVDVYWFGACANLNFGQVLAVGSWGSR